jgi:hypothetical protein
VGIVLAESRYGVLMAQISSRVCRYFGYNRVESRDSGLWFARSRMSQVTQVESNAHSAHRPWAAARSFQSITALVSKGPLSTFTRSPTSPAVLYEPSGRILRRRPNPSSGEPARAQTAEREETESRDCVPVSFGGPSLP